MCVCVGGGGGAGHSHVGVEGGGGDPQTSKIGGKCHMRMRMQHILVINSFNTHVPPLSKILYPPMHLRQIWLKKSKKTPVVELGTMGA